MRLRRVWRFAAPDFFKESLINPRTGEITANDNPDWAIAFKVRHVKHAYVVVGIKESLNNPVSKWKARGFG